MGTAAPAPAACPFCSPPPAAPSPHGQRRPAALQAGEKKEIPLSLTLSEPLLWNDEYPNLYTASLLLELEGLPAQKLSWKVGFRRMEMVDSRPISMAIR